jgi:hypothetical protein
VSEKEDIIIAEIWMGDELVEVPMTKKVWSLIIAGAEVSGKSVNEYFGEVLVEILMESEKRVEEGEKGEEEGNPI